LLGYVLTEKIRAGTAAIAASHALSFATRFAENVRLSNLRGGLSVVA